jgi:hypothetical protein
MKKISCKDTCCHQCVRSVEVCFKLENALGRCNHDFGSRGCKDDRLSGEKCPEFSTKAK